MYHRLNNLQIERIYIELSDIVVEQVSGGVYYVKKDKYNDFSGASYIDEQKLLEVLNQSLQHYVTVTVTGRDIVSYANFTKRE